MPYLNLDPDFFTHPKTVRLCGLLGAESSVYPLRLWAYCAKYHAIDADLSAYSKAEIESAIGWRGEAGKLVDSLVQVGMLEECEGHFCVHDWKEHQGHLEAYKIRGKLAAEARWAKLRAKKVKNTTSNATGIPKAMPQPTNQPTNHKNIRDEIWDSVVELFFPDGLPPSFRSRIGKVVKDLKAVGATAEKISLRFRHMRSQDWGKNAGPESFVNNWSTLEQKQKSKNHVPSL